MSLASGRWRAVDRHTARGRVSVHSVAIEQTPRSSAQRKKKPWCARLCTWLCSVLAGQIASALEWHEMHWCRCLLLRLIWQVDKTFLRVLGRMWWRENTVAVGKKCSQALRQAARPWQPQNKRKEMVWWFPFFFFTFLSISTKYPKSNADYLLLNLLSVKYNFVTWKNKTRRHLTHSLLKWWSGWVFYFDKFRSH